MLRALNFTLSHRGGSGTPLVALHGFTDTWRTWELVLPALERRHDVLAPTLLGHAGGPPVDGEISHAAMVDAVERAMDEAGFETAHIVGNSMGGFVALQLASRGRARSVVALAPGGGWAGREPWVDEMFEFFPRMQALVKAALPRVDAIASTVEGRRRATAAVTERFEHIPAELVAHFMSGAAACEAVEPFSEFVRHHDWALDFERIECPVRIVWGTADRLLPWPSAAARFRASLPWADWVELDDVGHCPQLDVPVETAELVLGWTAG